MDDLINTCRGAPPETKAEAARRLAAAFDGFNSRVQVSNDEVFTTGEVAFTRGRFRVTLQPKSGGETRANDRRYLEVWRKEGGRRLVMRTMDNSE